MWKEGTIGVPDPNDKKKHTICHYWIKHFEEPSEHGIDNGRISKLTIKVDGKTTCNYDRGWDKKPQDEATEIAYLILLKEYN